MGKWLLVDSYRMWGVAAVTCFALVVANALPAAEKSNAGLAAAATINRQQLRDHVEVLANDTLEGRAAGSRGGRAAAKYLVQEFERLKLQPAGRTAGSFYQPFGSQYQNILALLPGSDPQVAEQMVIVGAHYDHVGYGNARNSNGPVGQIHNGADDNASGVAALLEMVEAIGTLPEAPRRSILFALWDCEEYELSGSQHWIDHPTVPRERVVLAFNLDMVGRLGKRKLEVIGWRSNEGMRRLVAEQNQLESLPLDFVWEIKRNSDHFSFFRVGIPVLMFHTGLHNDYHRPSDDAEKLDYAGMEQVSRLIFHSVRAVADLDDRPVFRTTARTESPLTRQSLETGVPLPSGRLGIEWDENDRADAGLKIRAVSANSAAAVAGLRSNDRLTKFGGIALEPGMDLRSLVLVAPQQIEVQYRRPGQDEEKTAIVSLPGEPTRVGISWRHDAAEPRSVVLVQVMPGSPAHRAGLRVADRVYQVDGVDFANEDEFVRLVKEHPLPMMFRVERNGQISDLQLPATPTVAAAETTKKATEAGQ